MSLTKDLIKKHINRVQNKINILIANLEIRSIDHDSSKLFPPEIVEWENMDKEPRYPYGTKEYNDKKDKYQKVFDMHYAANRHHPEHFKNGIKDMNLVDVMEMLCDWISYRDEIPASEAIEIVEMQAERFGFSDEMKAIFTNTILDYFAKITN